MTRHLTAKVCGHPIPPTWGRRRRYCEDCRPGQVWGRPVGAGNPPKPWLATCGHERRERLRTSSGGRSVSKLSLCPDCDALRECWCGTSLAGRRPFVKFCSTYCREVASGQRRKDELGVRVCALDECDVEFRPWRAEQRYCCERHGKIGWNRESRADGRQPNPPWSDARRDAYHRRRAARKAASSGDPVRLAEIAARDGWRCGICGSPVDPEVSWPDSLSASLDHVVPLVRGGAHDPGNVQLAHLGCNSRKGAA